MAVSDGTKRREWRKLNYDENLMDTGKGM